MNAHTSGWLDDSGWRKQARDFFNHLPEHQRRRFAGLVSQQIGWGGVARVSELFKVNGNTVRVGRKELESGLSNHPVFRVRRKGAGRKPLEEVNPEVETDLLKLVELETAGDPCSSRKWARQTPKKLAERLRKKGHKISRETVRRLLKKTSIRCAATANASRVPLTPTETSNSTT